MPLGKEVSPPFLKIFSVMKLFSVLIENQHQAAVDAVYFYPNRSTAVKVSFCAISSKSK